MGHFGHLCTVDFSFQAHTSDLPLVSAAFRLRTCQLPTTHCCMTRAWFSPNLATWYLLPVHEFPDSNTNSESPVFLPLSGFLQGTFLPLEWLSGFKGFSNQVNLLGKFIFFCQGLVGELASPTQASICWKS